MKGVFQATIQGSLLAISALQCPNKKLKLQMANVYAMLRHPKILGKSDKIIWLISYMPVFLSIRLESVVSPLRRLPHSRLHLIKRPLTYYCKCGYKFAASPSEWEMFQDHYEAHVYEACLQRLNANSVVFDVGAHIGYYTIHFAKFVKTVVAIEPSPRNVRLLRKNLVLNGVSNVYVVDAAVSTMPGPVTFYSSYNTTWGSIQVVPPAYSGQLRVPAVRLDDLIKRFGYHSVDLIKIDVEGAEHIVLESLGSYLSPLAVRTFVIEVWNMNKKRVKQLLRRYTTCINLGRGPGCEDILFEA